MIILVLIAATAILVQCYHWYFVFQNAAKTRPPIRRDDIGDQPFLSVVICFHKPFKEIPRVLHSMVLQSYSRFEVVLVNDGPVLLNDDTLPRFIKSHHFIRYIEHQKSSPGKKGALLAGIEAAGNNWIVVTDIDCQPSREWLTTLVRYIPKEPGIVLGFSPYAYRSGLLNFIIRQETLLTAFQYLGWAQSGHAYMGVGRNMVSHKSIYQKLTFASHAHVPTGDDDLFVNQAAREFPVTICNDPGSFVISQPKESWMEWIHQKTRHKSGGKFYSWPSKIRISFFMVALIVEKCLMVYLFFVRVDLFILLIGLKMASTYKPLQNLYQKLDKKSQFWQMWVYEWIHVIYLIILAPYVFFLNKKQWE